MTIIVNLLIINKLTAHLNSEHYKIMFINYQLNELI